MAKIEDHDIVGNGKLSDTFIGFTVGRFDEESFMIESEDQSLFFTERQLKELGRLITEEYDILDKDFV